MKFQNLIDVVLICNGTRESINEFTSGLPAAIRIAADSRSDLAAQFRISSTPFAFIADVNGIVHGKGAPTSAEAFEWFAERLTDVREPSREPKLNASAKA